MKKPKNPAALAAATPDAPLTTDTILSELRALIEGTRQRVAIAVNRKLVLL